MGTNFYTSWGVGVAMHLLTEVNNGVVWHAGSCSILTHVNRVVFEPLGDIAP
jgi:hypothetical protein